MWKMGYGLMMFTTLLGAGLDLASLFGMYASAVL